MFKVFCINNEYEGYIFQDLKIGEMYDAEILGNTDIYYKIYQECPDDPDFKYNVHYKHLFITLAKWRDRQINSILNDENSLHTNT